MAIVASHLHFDHIGALREFPGIPIHVQREELMTAMREPQYTIRSRISDPVLQYVEPDGDAEISEGIRLIAAASHTPGHQSVAVDTSEGLVILAGQAAYTLTVGADPAAAGEERGVGDAGPGSLVPQLPDYGIGRRAQRGDRSLGLKHAGDIKAVIVKTPDFSLPSEFSVGTGWMSL